jgi:hypothetical protein
MWGNGRNSCLISAGTRDAIWYRAFTHQLFHDRHVVHRVPNSQYLSNIIEQEHLAIKRRCACMLGSNTYPNASFVMGGIELTNRMRKKQLILGGVGVADPSALKNFGDAPCPVDYSDQANTLLRAQNP